ncbi:MAG: OmpA family protein [Elusimicrobiota bacterium]|jgi:outer membrane protein OmpA-like peptidoglycan-associated protein|nr:OmpA family protein [Elusimicrobiota bacterium]
MIFKRQKTQDDSFWITMADLLACIMLIFMFLTFYYVHRGLLQERGVYDALKEEFDEEKQKELGITITKDGIIRFSENAAFEINKYQLKPEFKRVLSLFIPAYINKIYDKYGGNIMEIRIEGHTSSEFAAAKTAEEAYILNMELSQNRAREVLNYILTIEELKQKPGLDWIKKKITANGLSSSRLIYKSGGKEDFVNSKRVDFRILLEAGDEQN